MNTKFVSLLSVTILSLLALMQLPFIYAVDASERGSTIEKRQEILDKYCIGICPKGPIGTDDIKDGAVTNPKLADNAVTADKIEDNTITGSKISGLEKLLYSSCTINIPSIEEAESIACLAPNGAEGGDKVIASLQQVPCCPAPVYVGAAVFQSSVNGLVWVGFGFVNSNEDIPTSPGEVTISFMIFKEQ
jgi:hypothetical protein